MQNYTNVDCSKGREMGCQTFCCRLLVRLDDDERMEDGLNFVEKGADGYCKHLNRENHLCGIWERRSRVCRGYDCNSDFLLQAAVRHTFGTVTELFKLAATAYTPKEMYLRIPPAID